MRLTTWLAAVSFVLAAGASQATSYKAVGGFSKKANPNGPWSDLAAGSLLTMKLANVNGASNVNAWWNGGQIPNSALIARNQSGQTQQTGTVVFPTDHLLLDPENLSDVTVRFTAPLAGSYTLAGDFKGEDTNEQSHPVGIKVNGTSIFGGTIASFGQVLTFRKQVTLSAGDTVDFFSATNGSNNLSTGLKATIAAH